jgi:hypothetical protein
VGDQDVADRAVKKVFAILGVDIDKPESIEEFREDLRFGRKMRRAADHSMMAIVGTVAVGLCIAVWTGFAVKSSSGMKWMQLSYRHDLAHRGCIRDPCNRACKNACRFEQIKEKIRTLFELWNKRDK